MMKKLFALLLALCAIVFVACESTKLESELEPDQAERTAYAESSGPAKKESQSSALLSSKAQFKKLAQDVKISVVSSPKETVKGKEFSSPYKIQALNSAGAPCAELKVTAEYPIAKNGGDVSYEKADLLTDKNGFAEFLPPLPAVAISDKVLFYPAPPSSDPELVRLASAAAAEATWKVRTNLNSRTGILVSIVDYRQDGKVNIGNGAQPSAQALTSNLWRANLMGAQNADFHNSIDADDPVRIRNDALKQLNGNSLFKFVVYGRVKYAGPVSQDKDGYYVVTFNGDVGALSIASGDVLVKASKSVTVKDKSEWKAVSTAQQEMAKLFCEELLYSLYN